MNLEQLENILKNANTQLAKYKEALSTITKAGIDNWAYEVYVESLRIGSSGETKPLARQQWENMFTKTRLKLRESAIESINEGQQIFYQIKTTVEAEIKKKEKI